MNLLKNKIPYHDWFNSWRSEIVKLSNSTDFRVIKGEEWNSEAWYEITEMLVANYGDQT